MSRSRAGHLAGVAVRGAGACHIHSMGGGVSGRARARAPVETVFRRAKESCQLPRTSTPPRSTPWVAVGGRGDHRRARVSAPVPLGHRRMRAAARRHPRRRRLERPPHATSSDRSSRRRAATSAELVLIDGQQRITTLMLLIAALHHTVQQQPSADSALAAELEPRARGARMTRAAPSCARTAPGPTCSRAWCSNSRLPEDDLRDSRFDDNYAFFRSQVPRRGGAAHLEGTAEARARGHHPRRRRQRAADLREPQLHRRAAARSRADPQLRAHGPVARRAERDRARVLGADRAEHRRVDRQLLAPLPGDAHRPRGRRRRVGAACTSAFRHRFPRLDRRDPAAHSPPSGRSSRRSTACSSTRTSSRTQRSPASSATSTPSAVRCIRSSCACIGDHSRGEIEPGGPDRDAGGHPVPALATHGGGSRQRAPRRPALSRAVATARTASSERSGADHPVG